MKARISSSLSALAIVLAAPAAFAAGGFPEIQTNCASEAVPFDYGGLNQNTNTTYADSNNANSGAGTPSQWWKYADKNNTSSTLCTNHFVGLLWGANGTKNANIVTWWYDYNFPPAWTVDYCPNLPYNGHFHTSTYVMAWVYKNGMWRWDFFDSYGESPTWKGNYCDMTTESAETGLPAAFNWRATTTNSDYIRVLASRKIPWLLILSQGNTHLGDIGCGSFGCFARVMTATWYD